MATTIRVTTTAHYRGLPVTILGNLDAGLLAIAGYGTPQELAMCAIAVERRGGRRVCCVVGGDEWTTSMTAVAEAAVRAREAQDAS